MEARPTGEGCRADKDASTKTGRPYALHGYPNLEPHDHIQIFGAETVDRTAVMAQEGRFAYSLKEWRRSVHERTETQGHRGGIGATREGRS